MLNFFFLILSALCDSIWNIYLTKSKGLTDWVTNAIGVSFLIAGIFTFKKSLSTIPLSIAIVIWTGLSLMLTIVFDMYIFKTKIDYKVAFFMGLCVVSIIGLNYYGNKTH